MLERIPTQEELVVLLGSDVYEVWQKICDFVNENYDMNSQWNNGGKGGLYEYKFRKSSKTLCTLYAKEKSFGFMVIYGKNEREKFETERQNFSDNIQSLYDKAQTYHDGKWIMVNVLDDNPLEDIKNMLKIKKKSNKK
ncbi:DUF3788 domain-containing protein [Desulfosporosinus sp. SYSU MS00001]|uniref:DUF3788 domain-containing protein n=1 Tax=Desulfosporosinus sp. SYSU MS00001 TaxID=3416284 RepID=UPI003CF8F202